MKKIFMVFILVLIGAGLFFVYQSIALTPQKVMHKMAMQFPKIKTCHINANINADGKSKGGDFSAKLTLHGAADIAEKKTPKFDGLLSGEIKATGISFSASAQIKALKDELYFQLVSIPETLAGMKLPPEVNKFKSVWIKIPVKNYKDINTELPQIDERKFEAALKKWLKERKFEKLPDETVNGKSCFHYKLILDKASINDLMRIVNDVSKEKIEQKNKEELDRALSEIKDIAYEFWIGKKDFLLYKANFLTQAALNGGKEKINLACELTFSKYNEMVNIQTPAVSVDLETVFAQFMKGTKMPVIKPTMQQFPNMPNMPDMPQLPPGFQIPETE